MKKLIGALFGVLVAGVIHAADYTVVRFEASDYRTMTMEEMKNFLGPNAHIVSQLKCNDRDEHDPFAAPFRMNPLRNSLSIRIPKTTTTYNYQMGRLFDQNNVEVFDIADPFVANVFRALKRFETIPVTAKLVRLLEESYFPLTIVRGNNSFNPQISGGKFWSGIKMAQAVAFLITLRMSDPSSTHPFSDIGVGGEILWNPNLKVESIEADGVKRELDSDVALAHEMYHAFDSIRGLLDMGVVSGKDYEWESVVEYRAVYFENLVRAALGIKYRKHYGDPIAADAPDLLDESGEPISIAAPCLAN